VIRLKGRASPSLAPPVTIKREWVRERDPAEEDRTVVTPTPTEDPKEKWMRETDSPPPFPMAERASPSREEKESTTGVDELEITLTLLRKLRVPASLSPVMFNVFEAAYDGKCANDSLKETQGSLTLPQ
jgi:hypothetical protein